MTGDIGGMFSSAIQAVLPRLLSAAAPPGSSANENRRQCLKASTIFIYCISSLVEYAAISSSHTIMILYPLTPLFFLSGEVVWLMHALPVPSLSYRF